MRYRSAGFYCLIVVSVLYAGLAQGQSDLKISGIKGSVNHRIGASILKAAYGKMGISIDAVGLPAKRSLVMVNAGEYDGEVQRIGDLEKQYPNLVVVPEPIFFLESSVFVKQPGIRIDGWSDLSPYLVGIPRGIIYLEQRTKELNRIFVKSPDQLFDLLDTGRIDVVIISTNFGQSVLKKRQNLDIRMLEPPILKIPLFHYLHRKHRDLVPKIAESIRQMRISGEIDALISQFRTDQ